MVRNGNFEEYGSKNLEECLNTLPLMLSTARPARDVDRRFCFEIVSAQRGTRTYQACDADDLKSWLSFFSIAIEESLNHCPMRPTPDNPTPIINSESRSSNEENSRRLQDILKENALENSYCADCNALNPDWASINIGCLICIECSGVHRSMVRTTARIINID